MPGQPLAGLWTVGGYGNSPLHLFKVNTARLLCLQLRRWRISARASRSSQGCALLLASLRRPLPLPFVSPIGRQLLACVPAWVI